MTGTRQIQGTKNNQGKGTTTQNQFHLPGHFFYAQLMALSTAMRKQPLFGLVQDRGYEPCIIKLTNRPLVQTGMDESFSAVMAEYKDAGLDNFELLSKYWALCDGQYDKLHEQWEGEVPSSWVAFSLMHEKNSIRLERDTWSLARKLSECRAYNLPEGERLVPGFDSTVQELSDHLIQTQRDLQEASIGERFSLQF
jgi:hypothetical protein